MTEFHKAQRGLGEVRKIQIEGIVQELVLGTVSECRDTVSEIYTYSQTLNIIIETLLTAAAI